MTISVNQLEEARRALEAPLFADLAGDAAVSFEFFPPKTEKMEEALWETVRTLEPFGPSFVSVTYGAGGTTRDRTHATVARIERETSMAAAAHLTCVEASREEVDEVIEGYKAIGVDHIVALRGDPPGGAGIGGVYQPRADGYANATELTAAINRIGGFDVTFEGERIGRDGYHYVTMLQRTGAQFEIELPMTVTPLGAVARLEHPLTNFGGEQENHRRRLAEAERRLASYRGRVGEAYAFAAELNLKRAQLADVEADLAASSDEAAQTKGGENRRAA